MRRGRVISKHRLQDALTGAGSEVSSNVVEVWVSNIRKKAGSAGAGEGIRTRRAFGFAFSVVDDDPDALIGKMHGECASEPLAGPGDDRHLIF